MSIASPETSEKTDLTERFCHELTTELQHASDASSSGPAGIERLLKSFGLEPGTDRQQAEISNPKMHITTIHTGSEEIKVGPRKKNRKSGQRKTRTIGGRTLVMVSNGSDRYWINHDPDSNPLQPYKVGKFVANPEPHSALLDPWKLVYSTTPDNQGSEDVSQVLGKIAAIAEAATHIPLDEQG